MTKIRAAQAPPFRAGRSHTHLCASRPQCCRLWVSEVRRVLAGAERCSA